MTLALRLHRTVDELLDALDSQDLTEWLAFEQLNGPLSEDWRGDHRAAVVAQTVGASVGHEGRVQDYMVEWGRDPDQAAKDRQDTARLKIMAWASAMKTNQEKGSTHGKG